MSDSIASVIGLKDTYAGFFREMIRKESNMDHHPIHVRLVNHGVSVKTAFPSPNISKKITTSNGSRKTITAVSPVVLLNAGINISSYFLSWQMAIQTLYFNDDFNDSFNHLQAMDSFVKSILE